MTAPAPLSPPPEAAASVAEERVSAADIDASCRWPVLLLFTKGIAWLVLGLLFALVAAIKMHAPGFLADSAWLTLGRIRPAAMNAILYGFASQSALGVVLWMLCRLGGTRLHFQAPINIAIAFWNLGVALGVLGILAGASTGFAWLEMPRYASPILFGSYAVIGACAMSAFYQRRDESLYVSQWYLVAALFWFPWVYSAASLLLVFHPVRGVVQSIIDAWFTNGFLLLWLAQVALAALYYFIPKLSRRPLHNQTLAAFGFWTLAVFGNWSGLAQLVGGPVPAWMTSAGIVANVLLLIPLIATALNWHLTLKGLYGKASEDVTLRFMLAGAGSYVGATLLGIILSLRSVSAVTHLTYVEAGQAQLAVLGFVGMTLLGCMHYLLPRLLGIEWPCARKVQVHFWCSAAGIAMVVLALVGGGLVQAFGIKSPSLPFISVVKSTVPFVGFSTLGYLLLLAGQAAFLLNLGRALCQYLEPLRKSAFALVLNGDVAKPGVRS